MIDVDTTDRVMLFSLLGIIVGIVLILEKSPLIMTLISGGILSLYVLWLRCIREEEGR